MTELEKLQHEALRRLVDWAHDASMSLNNGPIQEIQEAEDTIAAFEAQQKREEAATAAFEARQKREAERVVPQSGHVHGSAARPRCVRCGRRVAEHGVDSACKPRAPIHYADCLDKSHSAEEACTLPKAVPDGEE